MQGKDTTLLWSLRLFQPSVPQAGPKTEANSFFKTRMYFSSIKRLLHPDLELAAFHQQKHDLFVFPSLQSTLRSFKMRDDTEIPSHHIFIILAMSISRLKSGNFVSLLLLLLSLSWVILGKHSHARTVYMRLGACKRSIQFFTGITQIFCDLLHRILYFWIFTGDFIPRLYLPYMKWMISP